MEIKSNNILFHLEEKKINGITGNKLLEIKNIFALKNQIIINKKEIKGKEKYALKRHTEIIEEYLELDNEYPTIYEWLWYQINEKKIYPKDVPKKIIDAIKIVGLNEEIIERSFMDISSSEKKLLQIASALLSNPKIILLEEPFKVLDLKNKKKLQLLLQKLAEKYNKIILILTIDENILYQITKHMIFVKNNKVILEGDTDKVYQEVDLLKKNKIKIPEIVEFTYLVKKKNIKIDYYKDVRDIMKDIYKHVGR